MTGLLPEAKLTDELLVSRLVFFLEILEEAFSLSDQLHQSRAGMKILFVRGEMIDKKVDSFRQQGNLDFGRSGIAGSLLILLDDLCFDFLGQHLYVLLFFYRLDISRKNGKCK